jgi:hypothetical protein
MRNNGDPHLKQGLGGRRRARAGRPQLTAAERERLRRAYPGTFNNAARLAFMRQFPLDANRDGYPRDFRRWPRAKRAAWLAGFDLGFHDRLRFGAELQEARNDR